MTCGRGNNLHEVEACDGSKFLVSMPTKFRKSVWIKRGNYESVSNGTAHFVVNMLIVVIIILNVLITGDYVIIEPIAEGHKVQAEIVHILYPMQIKSLKQENLW